MKRYCEVKVEVCEGLKGIAQEPKPVDLEWPLSFIFYLNRLRGKGGFRDAELEYQKREGL